MNQGVLLIPNETGFDIGPVISVIIDAQVWADGQTNPINDEIMESDGVTLQRLFWGSYPGPGPGPVIPMDPLPPGTSIEMYIPSMNRLYEANDVRMFESEDNRIFEA